MISARNIRAMLKDLGPNALRDGSFKAHLRDLLGVKMKDNPDGRFPFKLVESEAQIHHEEFSIRDLYSEFIGRDVIDGLLNPKNGDDTQLREALDPVLSTNFQNINAVNATIGGLVEQRVLAGFTLPEFIADQVFETMPTSVNGGKLIGLPNITPSDGFTGEGEEHSQAGQSERWVIAPANKKKTRKLGLTREAVAYDLTGQLMSDGESMGKTLAYEKDYWCGGVAMGIDFIAGTPGFVAGLINNTYIYKGQPTDSPNATYQTAAGTGTSAKYNYINKFQNVLADYKNFQAVQAKLNLMREFETGFPITAKLKDVLVSPNSEYNARLVIHSTQVLNTTGTSGLSGVGVGTFAANPVPNVRILSSNIWNKLLVDSGVSQTNADIRWWAGDLKAGLVWREVWPMQVLPGNPSSLEMLDRQIVAAWFGSWYGTPMVRSPYNIIESTE